MGNVLSHRGPDDEGYVLYGRHEAGWQAVPVTGQETSVLTPVVALAQRRLSIIDLSPSGHQPMSNEDGRVWVVFNGEIYNFPQLREELLKHGHVFRSSSDTEVLVHGFEEWAEGLLPRLNGIFAFVIMDARGQGVPSLFLARDRFGVKPLYYAHTGDTFLFGSEMKALFAAGYPPRLDFTAMDAYFAFLAVPDPITMVQGVLKLPAGHYMRVTTSGTEQHSYWGFRLTNERRGSGSELAKELQEIVERSVARQTIADVPVAAFLSGGLDSSAVVAMMVRSGHAPSQVFTVGFDEEDRRFSGFPDDLKYARIVANQFHLDQSETILRPNVAELLPRLIWYLDEPIADPAIIPAYLMCEAAHQQTKVLLSGMGGDEILGGYRRHAATYWMRYYQWLPLFIRRQVFPAIASRVPSAGRNPLAPSLRRAKRFVNSMAYDRAMQPIALALWTKDSERSALFTQGVRQHLNGHHAWDTHLKTLEPVKGSSLLDQMLFGDATVYLPSHNLNYTDRMSMAASVEVRVPLLDNEVVDFASSLPNDMKVKRTTTKYLFRKSMEGVLPPEIITRQKTGLGMPVASWLTGRLKPLVDDVLSEERLKKRGLFSPRQVVNWQTALAKGQEDTSLSLWALLTLEMWMDAFKVEAAA